MAVEMMKLKVSSTLVASVRMRSELERLIADGRSNKMRVEGIASTMEEQEEELGYRRAASEVVRGVGDVMKRDLVGVFERVVTEGLREIYGPSYSFRVVLTDWHGDRSSAELIVSDGVHEGPPSTFGGGVHDIVSLLCWIVRGMMVRPALPPLRLLDEPLKWLGEEGTRRFARFLPRLCEEFGLQILLVTHQRQRLFDRDAAMQVSLVRSDLNGPTVVAVEDEDDSV